MYSWLWKLKIKANDKQIYRVPNKIINTTSISLKVLFVMEGRSGYGLQCVNQQISKYKQYKQLSTLYKIEHCMTKITRYKSRFLYPSLITTKTQTHKIKLNNYLNLNTNKKKLLQNLKLHRWAPVDTMWMQLSTSTTRVEDPAGVDPTRIRP